MYRFGRAYVGLIIVIMAASEVMPADTLPPYCGAVGAQRYQDTIELPQPVFSTERGSIITVTNASNVENGDTSGVIALLARSGADGISLREAITASNNQPGFYTIRFAASLRGSSIRIDATGLPRLQGGNLIINGDVDADGTPDISIVNDSHQSLSSALRIASSGNTLYALAIQDYFIGVLLEPAAANQTFLGNTVANLVIQSTRTGAQPIVLSSRLQDGVRSHLRWANTLIVGNQLQTSHAGISVLLDRSVGAIVENTQILNNTVRIIGTSGGFAIHVGSGYGPGASENRILSTLIANNVIEGGAGTAISATAGAVGSNDNIIDGVRIISNQIRLRHSETDHQVDGITIAAGDGASDFEHTGVTGPILYPDNNIVRNVEILRNTIEGTRRHAVFIQPACCGARSNSIRYVTIEGNTISGIVPRFGNDPTGVLVNPSSSGHFYSRLSSNNEVSNLTIRGNTVVVDVQRQATADGEFVGGGIVVYGAHESSDNRSRDITISHNDVRTTLMGINILGGWGDPPRPALGNSVARVDVQCNLIRSAPSFMTPVYPDTRGISLNGGWGAASGNRVDDVRIYDNLVMGTLDDFSIQPNVGSAAGNTVRTAGGEEPLEFAQFANGLGVTSDLLLINPSTTTTVSGRVDFADDNGLPMAVEFADLGSRSNISFSLEAGGSRALRSSGTGAFVSGSARVTANGRIGGVVRFGLPGIGVTGVGKSDALPRGFMIPVRRSRAAGLDTGVALTNAGDQPVTLTLVLRNPSGLEIPDGRVSSGPIAPGGHLSRFVGELFPNAAIGELEGTLTVTSNTVGGKIAGTAIEIGPGLAASLPVVALR